MRNPRMRPHDRAPAVGFPRDYRTDPPLLGLDLRLSLGCHLRPLGSAMTAPEKLYTSQGEVEARMGLIPLEELHQERDELVSQVARLRAVYGAGGTFDAL